MSLQSNRTSTYQSCLKLHQSATLNSQYGMNIKNVSHKRGILFIFFILNASLKLNDFFLLAEDFFFFLLWKCLEVDFSFDLLNWFRKTEKGCAFCVILLSQQARQGKMRSKEISALCMCVCHKRYIIIIINEICFVLHNDNKCISGFLSLVYI